MDVINIISIIVSPIIAVIVGQILQNNSKKRAEKLEIFKTLMVSRGLGWSVESVRALNVIEVVFGGAMSIPWTQKVELFSQHSICRENYFYAARASSSTCCGVL